MKKIELLKKNYNQAVSDYACAFCEKHCLDYNDPDTYWVANVFGNVLCVADYFISFKDIKTDIDLNVEEPKFFEWYDYSLKIYDISEGKITLEYEKWLKGERPFSEEDFQKIEEAHKRVEETKSELERLMDGSIHQNKVEPVKINKKVPHILEENVTDLGLVYPSPIIETGYESEISCLIENLRRVGQGSFLYDDTLYYVENGHILSKKLDKINYTITKQKNDYSLDINFDELPIDFEDKPLEWVDLGLPSGTKWASKNFEDYINWDDAMEKYGKYLPSLDQFKELHEECKWKWRTDKPGYIVMGKNMNYIYLPASGFRRLSSGLLCNVGTYGLYWSSASCSQNYAYSLYFYSNYVDPLSYGGRAYGQSVRGLGGV